jgi:hypothetical protein
MDRKRDAEAYHLWLGGMTRGAGVSLFRMRVSPLGAAATPRMGSHCTHTKACSAHQQNISHYLKRIESIKMALSRILIAYGDADMFPEHGSQIHF